MLGTSALLKGQNRGWDFFLFQMFLTKLKNNQTCPGSQRLLVYHGDGVDTSVRSEGMMTPQSTPLLRLRVPARVSIPTATANTSTLATLFPNREDALQGPPLFLDTFLFHSLFSRPESRNEQQKPAWTSGITL